MIEYGNVLEIWRKKNRVYAGILATMTMRHAHLIKMQWSFRLDVFLRCLVSSHPISSNCAAPGKCSPHATSPIWEFPQMEVPENGWFTMENSWSGWFWGYPISGNFHSDHVNYWPSLIVVACRCLVGTGPIRHAPTPSFGSLLLVWCLPRSWAPRKRSTTKPEFP